MNRHLVFILLLTLLYSTQQVQAEDQTDFYQFLQGFTQGYINEDISELKDCAIDSTEITKRFQHVIELLLTKKKDQMTQALHEFLEIIQMLPAQFQNCKTVKATIEKLLSKGSKLLNIVYFMKCVGKNLLLHGLDILAEFSKTSDSLLKKDFYKAGLSLGKAMAMIGQD